MKKLKTAIALSIIIISLSIFGCADDEDTPDDSASIAETTEEADATTDTDEDATTDTDTEIETDATTDTDTETDSTSDTEDVDATTDTDTDTTADDDTVAYTDTVASDATADEPSQIVIVVNVYEDDEPDTYTIIIDDPYELPTEPDEPPDATADEPQLYPKFVLLAGTDYYISDGFTRTLWKSGSIIKAGPGLYAENDQLTQYDNIATPGDAVALAETPTHIKQVNDSIYYCKEKSPTESYEAGAQAKYHTAFYKDDAVTSEWYLNQMSCTGIVSAAGQVFAVNGSGAYVLMSGTASNVMHVNDNEFYFHSLNTTDKTFEFNNLPPEQYTSNYTHGSRQWIELDGLFYSEKGDIWSEETGLLESVTAMFDFNSTPYPDGVTVLPTLLAGGESAGLLYWINTNTGTLFEFDPVANITTAKWAMYQGDGGALYGIAKLTSLKPMIMDGKLYFSNSGSVNYIDIESGMVVVFYGGEGTVFEF